MKHRKVFRCSFCGKSYKTKQERVDCEWDHRVDILEDSYTRFNVFDEKYLKSTEEKECKS